MQVTLFVSIDSMPYLLDASIDSSLAWQMHSKMASKNTLHYGVLRSIPSLPLLLETATHRPGHPRGNTASSILFAI